MAMQGVTGGVPLSENLTQIAGTTLGAPSAWGTAPTGNVVGGNVDVLASVLPTGAATSAAQTSVESAPGASQTTAITIQGNASGIAVPMSASALPLPSGASTAAAQTAVQSPPGTSAATATGVQGVTGGVPMATAPAAATAGGASSFSEIVPANTTGISIKASAGTIYEVNLANIGSTVLWAKIYDSATAPTCGSGTPIRRFMIPVNSTAANGAGSNISLGAAGIAFINGIGLCVTAGIADTDTTTPTASVAVVGISYK